MGLFSRWTLSSGGCNCKNELSSLEKRLQTQINENKAGVTEHSQRLQINTSDISDLKEQQKDMIQEISRLNTFHPEGGGGGEIKTYPPEEDYSVLNYTYTEPAPGSMPDYLVTEDVPESDSVVTRISDRTIFASNGATGNRIRHNYPLDQCFNADETIIKLIGNTACALIDADTKAVLDYSQTIPSDFRWSNLDPKLIYGVSVNSFVSVNIDTDSYTTIHTFGSYASIELGSGKGNIDVNDKYVGLIGVNGSTRTLIVYNIQTDTIEHTLVTADIRWFTVNKSGEYCIVAKNQTGTGSGTGGTSDGIYAYNLDFTNEQTVCTGGVPHGDNGFDQDGNPVFVGYATGAMLTGGNCAFMTRLDNGTQTLLVPKISGEGIWGGHISIPSNRPGWAYFSEAYGGDIDANQLGQKSLFALKLDTSNTIEFYGIHHGVATNYNHQPQACVNRDGTKIVFASNWNDDGEQLEAVAHSFLLEVNQ